MFDHDKNVEEYEEFYKKHEDKLILEEPNFYPNFTWLSCINTQCDYTVCLSDQELINEMRKHWAKFAWFYAQNSDKKKFQFGDMFASHLWSEEYKKFVTPEDLKNNKVIRDLVKYAEKQHTKKSKD